ncbi:MAG TPA: hypothetical protein ENJ93_00730 [Chloroflexi bacterium]|nr:hypothetical protein [Chloroflexota bacterium]
MKEQKKHGFLWLLFLGGLLITVSLMWPEPAAAQCGSSASSCKNCHEVQGEYPVNSDGTNWHEAHAFGDFCEFCHAGNVQATTKEEAHQGMEAPLDNIQASCGNCHAADLDERAGVYAAALGVELGAGGGSDGGSTPGGEPPAAEDTAAPPADTTESGSADTASVSSAPPSDAPSGLVVDDPNVIDYVARYNETALGIKQVNWGDRILWGLIVVTAVFGGAFVIWNERRLRRNRIPVSDEILAEQRQNYPEYPPQVVALLPRLAKLSPTGLNDMYRFLENPAKAETFLHDLNQLDPNLVKDVQKLDRESQALLLALAGSGD